MRENILIIGTVNNLLTRNRYMRKNRNWISGEWKYVNQSEKEVCQFLRAEERLNAELKHGHYDNFFDSEEEWLEYGYLLHGRYNKQKA